MEHWEPEQVRRIWQRVQNPGKPLPEENIHAIHNRGSVCKGIWELYAGELQDSALLFRISGAFSGQKGAQLRKIAAEDRAHGMQLQRICTIPERKAAYAVRQLPERGQPGILLQRCYGRKIQRAMEYESRSTDPRFGSVFRKMAAQEQVHCHIIQSIIKGDA